MYGARTLTWAPVSALQPQSNVYTVATVHSYKTMSTIIMHCTQRFISYGEYIHFTCVMVQARLFWPGMYIM